MGSSLLPYIPLIIWFILYVSILITTKDFIALHLYLDTYGIIALSSDGSAQLKTMIL
jgi:hypothetical protein